MFETLLSLGRMKGSKAHWRTWGMRIADAGEEEMRSRGKGGLREHAVYYNDRNSRHGYAAQLSVILTQNVPFYRGPISSLNTLITKACS